MSIESKEEAERVAQQVVERSTKITSIVDGLRNKDRLDQVCAAAPQLTNLLAANATAGRLLAKWILREPPPIPPPQIEGNGVAPSMLDAAEDLLHTRMSDEPPPLRALYEIVACAFGTTRDDAKRRLFAAYSEKGFPPTPREPSA